MTPRFTAAAVAAFALACVLAGCFGGDDSDTSQPVPAEAARVDSALDFSGQKRKVAEVIERFEAAVLAGDVETICRDLLAVEENHGNDSDNGGHDFCVKDPANQPASNLAESGEYDLIVESVERDGAIHGRDRFRATVTGGEGREEFSVQSLDGRWLITSRDLSVDGDSTRLAGEFDCERGGHAEMGVSFLAPPKRTDDPREAVLLGPFGKKAQGAIDQGGSLELDSVFYRPDYQLMYALADKKGRVIVRFPVTVWGPGNFDVYSMTFCRHGQQGMVII